MNSLYRALLAFALTSVWSLGMAQSLPVAIDVAGKTAHATIGLANDPIAELILTFDDATGLSAEALGISAGFIDPQDLNLLSRLPDLNLTTITSGLPVLITIEPPVSGFSFRRVATVEIHTHQLEYSVGTPLRVFKAPLGGAFRDITREVIPGSVRARSGTGSFSQFMIVSDLRPSTTVIAEKLDWLRSQVDTLDLDDRDVLNPKLDAVESAVAEDRFNDAAGDLDGFSAHVSAQSGVTIPEQWVDLRDQHNAAGELLSGAASLKFSIAFLRDQGI